MKKSLIATMLSTCLALTLTGCGSNYDFVTLPDYKAIPIASIDEVSVSEVQITSRIESNMKANVVYQEITDRVIQKNDIVNLDIDGTVDGVSYSNSTVVGYDIKIGSESFLDGFDQALIGRDIGANFIVNLTFPDSYFNSDVAGKPVDFQVKVNGIREQLDPVLSDAFVKKLSTTATTVEEYRLEIKKQLETELAESNKNNSYEQVWTYVVTNTEVDSYPTSMLNDEISAIEDNYIRMADLVGVELELYVINNLNLDAESFKLQNKNMAEYNLKETAILMTIANNENLEPSNDEYIDFYQDYVIKYGCSDVNDLLQVISETSLQREILMKIVKEFLVVNAVQTDK